MNIDIANKLYQLRREKGLSQEELAAQLGISRQAVSKWERAEAAPDTDNLIMLANLYGISLDELLLRSEKVDDDSTAGESTGGDGGKDSGETVYSGEVKDSKDVKFEKGAININCDDGSHVHVGLDGVFVRDPNGKEDVHVGWDGIHVDEAGAACINDEKFTDEDGTVHIKTGNKTVTIFADGSKHIVENDKGFWHYVPWPLCTLIAFLLIGFLVEGGTALPYGGTLPQGWAWGWLCFLTVPLYYSFFSALRHRDPTRFAFPILTILVYCGLGLFWSLWHPGWIVFLLIPVYFPIAYAIKKHNRKKAAEKAGETYVEVSDESYDWDDED